MKEFRQSFARRRGGKDGRRRGGREGGRGGGGGGDEALVGHVELLGLEVDLGQIGGFDGFLPHAGLAFFEVVLAP